jgi:predicted Rossmann fold flavoprotein
MAAATIHELSPQTKVIVIEKNAVLGRKVQISGGGRCNVTTGIRDVKQLLTRYPRGKKFLNTAMYHFSPEQVYDWFEAHGVPLKIEPDLRVFPQSDNGQDVVGVFVEMFAQAGAEVLTRQSVTAVEKVGEQFKLTLQSGTDLLVDQLILTTGGQAYRHTGSTGDGYKFAETLGHHITPLFQSLNSFTVQDDWVKQLSGVSFTRVTLSANDSTATGPIVLTHQGLSGPAVFALSSEVASTNYSHTQPLLVQIDFLPDTSETDLTTRLNTIITEQPKLLLKNTLHTWLPKSVVDELMGSIKIPVTTTNATANKAMRLQIVAWLKHCVVQVVGRGGGDEFVTAGGVELNEVDPRTMQSKICPHLYFAGEILNIDGYTGGFNLQAAWATGHLAGTSVATSLTQ